MTMKFWICMAAAVLILSGCGNKQAANEPKQDNPQTQGLHQNAADNPYSNQTGGLDQQGEGNTSSGEQLSAAEHLEQIATQVEGVNSAHAVMVGDNAVVGINVDGKLDRSRVGSIKYSVAEALNKDPQGANAVVTADLDITNRLAEMANSISDGNPVKGMADELADIIGRIVPQMPGDTETEDNQRLNSPAGEQQTTPTTNSQKGRSGQNLYTPNQQNKPTGNSGNNPVHTGNNH